MKTPHYVIRTNYGDDSIALIQWASELGLAPVTVAYIDTHWAAARWSDRITQCEQYVNTRVGFKAIRICTQIRFEEAIRGRQEFPCSKFQWCASLLKGLPFLDWLDEWDPQCEAIILIAKRRVAATAHQTLPEWIESCEYHQGRKLWHPILKMNDEVCRDYLARAGFSPLGHRSLECDPCVNSTSSDIARMDAVDIDKVQRIEESLNTTFFNRTAKEGLQEPIGIREAVKQAQQELQSGECDTPIQRYLDLFYRGCGNPWGCGL